MFDAVGSSTADLSNYRPFRDPTFALSTVYVDTLGSDVTGEGTSGNPFASIERAASIIPTGQLTSVVIQLNGAGPYNCPVQINAYNNIILRGSETTEFTRSISSVSSTSTTNGIVFTLAGAALTANQLKGRHLKVTGVLSGSRNIIVGYNDTSNVCSGVMHNRTFLSDIQSSPAGGSVDVITYTQLNLTANTIISGSVNFSMEMVRVTGNFTLFANATEKLNAWKCQFQNLNLNAGRAGGIYALSCTIETIGSSTAGLIAIRNGGDFRLGYGTLVTDTNSGANNAFISGSSGGILTTEGGVVFSNLDAKGIELDNVNISSVSQPALKMIFENWSGAASCAAGFRINKNGGSGTNYSIADARGAVLSNYYVEAEANAFVKIASGTSVATATDTNAVSADGGTNNVAIDADGTRIEGGSPSLTGVLIPQEEYDIIHDASAATLLANFHVGFSNNGPKITVMGIDNDVPPIIGNDLGDLFIPKALAALNADLTITEENTVPVGSVEIYAKPIICIDANGIGKTVLQLYATTAGEFQDDFGRRYTVRETATPNLDPQMFPLYVDPAAGDEREVICCPGIGSDGHVLADDGGWFNVRGNANTLPLYLDPAAADKKLALFYDNAGSGVDLTAVSGYTQNTGGDDLTEVKASAQLYFDENQTDPSRRLFHRSPFTTNDIKMPIGGLGLLAEARYDGTSSLGVPVYIDQSGFPATLKANLPSAASKTFKTSARYKSYQSTTE